MHVEDTPGIVESTMTRRLYGRAMVSEIENTVLMKQERKMLACLPVYGWSNWDCFRQTLMAIDSNRLLLLSRALCWNEGDS